MMLKFSVIIPVHNKFPHLERSINSVLNQTYQNLEILIIDDASSDGSEEKIKEFKDPRIKIFTRTTPGPGGYAARNLGISHAEGDYITFLDSDDEWTLDHLYRMSNLIKVFPEMHFFSSGWRVKEGATQKDCPFFSKMKKNESIKIEFNDYFNFKLKKLNPECTIVACIKRTSPVLDNLFPKDPDVKRSGDSFAWLKLICYHRKMVWSNHIGAVYHRDSTNMVTMKNKANIDLFSYQSYLSLSKDLSNSEKTQLLKYFNFKIRSAFIELNHGFKIMNLLKSLFKYPITNFTYNVLYVIAARVKHRTIGNSI